MTNLLGRLTPFAIAFFAALALTLVLTPIVREVNRRLGMVDKPDPRRINWVPSALSVVPKQLDGKDFDHLSGLVCPEMVRVGRDVDAVAGVAVYAFDLAVNTLADELFLFLFGVAAV